MQTLKGEATYSPKGGMRVKPARSYRAMAAPCRTPVSSTRRFRPSARASSSGYCRVNSSLSAPISPCASDERMSARRTLIPLSCSFVRYRPGFVRALSPSASMESP